MLRSDRRRRTPAISLFALLLLPIAALAHGQGPKSVVVFGDSLSDPGNVFALTGGYSRAPFEPIPTFPYLIGAFHYSNGATWVEQLHTVTPWSSRPAFRLPGFFTNYAVGGSRARNVAGDLPQQTLGFQVQQFLADSGGAANPKKTYVIFMGGNDVRDALVAAQLDPTFATSQQILLDAVGSVATQIQVLYGAGARKFVLVNVPDVGLAPAVTALGPQAAGAATLLSSLYNGGLDIARSQLSMLPGATITGVDVFTRLHLVVADPSAYGLTNVTAPCLTFFVSSGFLCSHPGRYLFWDGIHPTRAGHRILAGIIGPAL